MLTICFADEQCVKRYFEWYQDGLLEGNDVSVLDTITMNTIPDGSSFGQMCLVYCVEAESCKTTLLATRGSTHTCVLVGIAGDDVTETAYLPNALSWNEPWHTLWNQLGGPPDKCPIME